MSHEYFPAEVPPHWGVCFAVADCDAAVAKRRELRATITNEPMGHADRPLRRPDRPPEGLVYDHADDV